MLGPGIGLSLPKAARDGKRHWSKMWLWESSVDEAPAWDLILDSDPSALDDYDYLGFTPFEWPQVSGTVTISIASPAVISRTNHVFLVNQQIRLTTSGTLPTGLATGTLYYVIAAGFGANSFQLSETQGGSAINTSGSQSGTHTALFGGTPPAGIVTISIATPAVVSRTSHTFLINQPVRTTTTGTLPTGMTAGTNYYVISSGFGANSFQISETIGGSAINTSGSQSGSHTAGASNSYVWNVNFTDGVAPIEIVMNQSWGSQAAAEVYFLHYVNRLAQLPTLFRTNLNHILGYQGGAGGASAEDLGHFWMIYSNRADDRLSTNKLEDTFWHESTHATIQAFASGKGYPWLVSPEWANARNLDNAAATEYGQDGVSVGISTLPERTLYDHTRSQEDFAESSLLAYVILFNPDRFTTYRTSIQEQIPHRIEFFRRYVFKWALLSGSWNDLGFWDDNAVWSDS